MESLLSFALGPASAGICSAIVGFFIKTCLDRYLEIKRNNQKQLKECFNCNPQKFWE